MSYIIKKKQICLTANKHPRELDGLMDKLINRFKRGLIVDIQPS
jgi:chromosomal replication initiation ATPase DnaA